MIHSLSYGVLISNFTSFLIPTGDHQIAKSIDQNYRFSWWNRTVQFDGIAIARNYPDQGYAVGCVYRNCASRRRFSKTFFNEWISGFRAAGYLRFGRVNTFFACSFIRSGYRCCRHHDGIVVFFGSFKQLFAFTVRESQFCVAQKIKNCVSLANAGNRLFSVDARTVGYDRKRAIGPCSDINATGLQCSDNNTGRKFNVAQKECRDF